MPSNKQMSEGEFVRRCEAKIAQQRKKREALFENVRAVRCLAETHPSFQDPEVQREIFMRLFHPKVRL